jgi:hypothetical protein
VGSSVARMARHANSALLAVACDDLSIRMFDVEVGLGSFTDTTRSAFHQMFTLHCHTVRLSRLLHAWSLAHASITALCVCTAGHGAGAAV